MLYDRGDCGRQQIHAIHKRKRKQKHKRKERENEIQQIDK